MLFFVFLSVVQLLSSEIYFREEFDLYWKKRWVLGKYYEAEGHQGTFGYETPTVYANAEAARGIITQGANRQFQISCDINKTISSFNKTFIVSFTLNYIQDQVDHAEAYIKLFPEGFNQTWWSANETGYLRMGSDIATDYARFYLDFYRGNNRYRAKQNIPCKNDKNTHLYTLVMYPNLTFEVHVDDFVEVRGKAEDMWDFFPPREYIITNATKPDDWDDREFIVDETDVKPEDWDVPPTIPDPTSVKPKDWNEEEDGEWIPVEVANPRYKGMWHPKMLPNPNYNGTWEKPRRVNPYWQEQFSEENLAMTKIRYVAIDGWQTTPGTLFDNIFIGDDINEYRAFVQTTWYPQYRKEIEGTGADEMEEQYDYELMGFWSQDDEEELEAMEEEEDKGEDANEEDDEDEVEDEYEEY